MTTEQAINAVLGWAGQHPILTLFFIGVGVLYLMTVIFGVGDRRDQARRKEERRQAEEQRYQDMVLHQAIMQDPDARALYEARQQAQRAETEARYGTYEQQQAALRAARQPAVDAWKQRTRAELGGA